ncbi:RecQ family ATP-dependent DNA helicase [Solirubrobacter ginsenosidimutans]|uniref:ATP-dependent DNA helicase RecQ n=1 Tax=Solirubrobacter ginsenosidimutans TaxID=490573 RepID=A0A9X3MXY6_9ACTN|nr:RecQ family ATP-dependent DNA helicase [Solirubrobacter ginsenosidimutans]MDA0164622.1 RecQ family ATP-dependent DNA helicase [Solirubrobacter ginsenosidimutans]
MSLPWLEEPPPALQTSLDLGVADGRVPRVPVARATDVDGALAELFGFPGFRPGQREAVEAARNGRDVLVVMPTGSGKSLCYQLPALMRTDLTLVVSPLVSLMQDQVEALERIAPGRVALVNAQQDSRTNRLAIEHAISGQVRLLYVAPERFASPGFLERIRHAEIGLFVVDEAHCVSQWGHDFRPEYFRLADAARWLGAEAILASTATATPEVAADIVSRLGLREPVHVATGFDRPNLTFSVVQCPSKDAVQRRIVAALEEPDALPAIVYAGTRSEADRLADRLGFELGVEVLAYHAGLPRDVRAEAQRRFMAGSAPVVVATNAFGMGVDKADVRTVCHESVPSSIEAYYQEAGRAGRDGKPARCLLFATGRDKGLHVFFIERSAVGEDLLKATARKIVASAEGSPPRYNLHLNELAEPGEEDAVRAVVGYLARAGVIQPAPSAPDRVAGRIVGTWDRTTLAVCKAATQEGTRVRWRQYRSVWAWVEGEGCRRRGILGHFGDRSEPEPTVPCCDVCDPAALPEAPVRVRQSTLSPAADLDTAILDVVSRAVPGVGRTRCVEILRGGRSKLIAKHSYDGLPSYGAYRDLRAEEVAAAIDGLLAAGRLRATDGRFPKLEVVRTPFAPELPNVEAA